MYGSVSHLLRGNRRLTDQSYRGGVGSDDYELWVHNGGDPAFYKAVDHYDWLCSLWYYIKDDYLFVHGVAPGVPQNNAHTISGIVGVS